METYEFDKSPDEMDADEARATLNEFMAEHESNVADYNQLEDERDDLDGEVDELESEVSEFSETEDKLAGSFAEVVAEEWDGLEADEVADRFSLGELISKAEALGAFSLGIQAADDGSDDDVDGDEGNTFDEKPDTAPTGTGGSGGGSQFTDQAKGDLESLLGTDLD